MNVPLIKRLNSFLDRHRLWILKDIALFVVILFGFHFFYNILLRPLITMDGYNFVWIYLQQLLYRHSTWVMEHIFGWAFMREGYHIVFPGHGSIIVDESCSATKWLLHFLVLMLIFPGPWKHKLWFIPLGLIVVHLISISRIVGLSAVVDIPVILTPHSGHIDPLGFWCQRTRQADCGYRTCLPFSQRHGRKAV
jgi:exosortase/archaeosortase family protein